VWYDRYLNWLASHIVAISEVVERVLIERESLDPRKCRRIPHGFEERLFSKIDTERIEKLKHKYALHNAYPVVGVVARFTKWKGIQYIIPAFRQLVTMYPRAHLLMANAKGDFSKELHRELSTLPKGSFTTIDFEADMPALYKCMDVYVHTPIDTTSEAFGQTYIEAALAGVPLVCTISGIANEWVVHETHALVVPYQQVEPITSALHKILTGPQETQSRIEAAVSAARHYSLDQHLLNLAALYQESEH
jgi:glycosyltransferase involved in cell wall biosynthesis